MECSYTHLNCNFLVSQKKSGHQGSDYKLCIQVTALIYFSFGGWCDTISLNIQNPNWYYSKVVLHSKYSVKAILVSPLKIPSKLKDLRLGPTILELKCRALEPKTYLNLRL
jgi:hypothetical protein